MFIWPVNRWKLNASTSHLALLLSSHLHLKSVSFFSQLFNLTSESKATEKRHLGIFQRCCSHLTNWAERVNISGLRLFFLGKFKELGRLELGWLMGTWILEGFSQFLELIKIAHCAWRIHISNKFLLDICFISEVWDLVLAKQRFPMWQGLNKKKRAQNELSW